MFHHYRRWSPGYAYAYGCSTGPRRHRKSHSDATYESRRHGRSNFGVRRPLRYLSYHLDLDESQVRKVAAILDQLKNEREQAKLDESRTTSDLASLVTNPDLSVDMLKDALAPRVSAAERLQLAVARAVQQMAVVLDPDQREEFAYLLTSKTIVL